MGEPMVTAPERDVLLATKLTSPGRGRTWCRGRG
jgi:hypothetical protein